MIRLFLLIISMNCCTVNQNPPPDSVSASHPAFNERNGERWNLVYREVANYPGINIEDTSVLAALYRTPRHFFVPSEMQAHAYRNTPLPIGYDQTISQPVIVASMTDLLQLQPGDKVLEIGTGSGYQAAVLAEMGCEVYSIEIVKELGERARNKLEELGYKNIKVRIGDGYAGWPEYAPFDKIIVTCAPEKVPQPLIDQLSENGLIVIPVGRQNSIQYLVVLTKTARGKMKEEYKYPVRFVPMTGKIKEK